jgi:pyrroloquinoline quinone biosynthesis protein B
VALVEERGSVLINAGPDFASQVDRLPRNEAPGKRATPVAAVLLTNADLDHVLGLIAMREGADLHLYATAAVRRTLTAAFPIEALLRAFTEVHWHEVIAHAPFTLASEAHRALEIRALFLPGTPPPFDRASPGKPAEGHSVAYEVHDRATGKRLLVAPDVGAATPELLRALEQADAILFDGTFWSDDELRHVKPGARTAREMGHVPIEAGSLDLLRKLPAPLKSYFHINNTNPILDPTSPERAAVESAGIRVEEDGAEWIL